MQGDEIEAQAKTVLQELCLCTDGAEGQLNLEWIVHNLTAAEARGYERGRKEADQDAVDDAEANPEAPDKPSRMSFEDHVKGTRSSYQIGVNDGFLRCREEAARLVEAGAEHFAPSRIAAAIRSLKP